ncbi:MAG: glycine betaine ABC transporter substrate-binding protein [Phycisphaerae bacterium]
MSAFREGEVARASPLNKGGSRGGRSRRFVGFSIAACAFATAPAAAAPPEIRVGSKSFTESVILGEMAVHLSRDAGGVVSHRRGLGGTRVLWNALLVGDLDIYPEYTGTISEEILAGQSVRGEDAIRAALAERDVRMTRPFGFNNTYILGMNEHHAARLGIRTISELRDHPDLRLGFSNEFMARGDGWPSLRARYRLPHKNVRGLEHDLAYRGLEAGSIDVIDLYATDAEIPYYGLRSLADDLNHFPRYDAVLLYRSDLAARAPNVVAALTTLEGRITEEAMSRMNRRAKIDRVDESRVAADYLEAQFGIAATVDVPNRLRRLAKTTREHLALVGVSLTAAILLAVPLGVAAAKWARFGQVILAVVGVVQTVPSLALLVFMVPLLGLGERPAIAALFFYSLLPIVRNTYTGIHDIPNAMRESAQALGLSPAARLWRIELPMASRTILAGIKTASVINVGTATLGGFVGAGGYGEPIFTGIRLDNTGLILEGAVPAALLALIVQGAFDLADRFIVPKGLRLKPIA